MEIYGTPSKNLLNASSIFGLMSDPTRLNILATLLSKKELCVTQIAKETNLSLSAASHQLRKLELLGVVNKCRYGQEICYCINSKSILAKRMVKLLKSATSKAGRF